MMRSAGHATRPLGPVLAAMFLAAGCSTGQVGASEGASPSPTPSLAPSPTPRASSVAALPVGDLEARKTYSIDGVGPQRLLFTVPATGWLTVDTGFLGKNDIGDPERFDLTLLPYLVGNVYADPCHWLRSALDPPVGPTVDDLATALVVQAGPEALVPTDVTLDGYAGKKVELSIPDEVDTATCDEGEFGRWSPADDASQRGPFTYGNGQRDTVYIVNVDGTRWVIDTNYLPGTSKANLAELEQLVASIRFEP